MVMLGLMLANKLAKVPKLHMQQRRKLNRFQVYSIYLSN
jgi:hypothetical protein